MANPLRVRPGRQYTDEEFEATLEADARRRRWIDLDDATVQAARAAVEEIEPLQGRETRKRARGRTRQPQPTPDEEAKQRYLAACIELHERSLNGE